MSQQLMHLPCGGAAFFDGDYSYRCADCMAVVGSMGQPRRCKEEAEKYDMLGKLGSAVKWDYQKGCEVTS